MVFSLFQEWFRQVMAVADVRRRSFGQLLKIVETQMPVQLRGALANCTYEACQLASKSLDEDWILYFDRHTP